MIDRFLIKQRAKVCLTQNYFSVLCVILLTSVISAFGAQDVFPNVGQGVPVTVIALCMSILWGVFVNGPLAIGKAKYIIEATRGNSRMGNMFSLFQRFYFKSVGTALLKHIILFLVYLPSIALYAFSFIGIVNLSLNYGAGEIYSYFINNGVANTAEYSQYAMRLSEIFARVILENQILAHMTTLGNILLLPALWMQYRLRVVLFLAADYPSMAPTEIIKRGFKIMKGKCIQAAMLDMSFVCWFIVGMVFTLLGIFYVIPYYEIATAEFYNEITKPVNHKQ